VNKRLISVLALAALALSAAASLEVKQGLVKLVIDETSARVSLYRLIDIAKGRYEPLLFDQDPRTSYAALSFDGKIYKLGDSADYRFQISQTETGARVEFRSSSCVVDEDVSFIASEGSTLADGVEIRYSLENVSQQDASVGLKLLLDTWLGEKGGAPFRTDRRPKVEGELSLDPRSPDAWISTPGDRADLMIELSGPLATRPDAVVLANWKRLNDAPWTIDAVPDRSFTVLPYSVHDSAVALFWEPILVAKGEKRAIVAVLGNFNEKGYPASSGAADSTAALFSKSVLAADSGSKEAALQGDLLTVRDLISAIDLALSSGKELSADQVATWRKILDSLEERRKSY
jgi:hypothetical protein